jgi:CDP-glucose 4,6-dehydratase
MEDLVIDPAFWNGRRVFLTGHTGFKGAWTSFVLRQLGAKIFGFSLPPDQESGLFVRGRLASDIHHAIGDVRDLNALHAALSSSHPSIVIHMAAQSLVRRSYVEPLETYGTNVMGTANLLEAVRRVQGIQAVVIVTSDKCYENTGSIWAYRETDPMGGADPYSSSKGCAELVTSAYRHSFFSGNQRPKIASARAGNVIGGGDWAQDRLVPDAIRAFMADKALEIRNPAAVRPWQHVLDPVCAYLSLAQRLMEPENSLDEGWNFGPAAASNVPVRTVIKGLIKRWGAPARWTQDRRDHPQEAHFLSLDCTKARLRLGWQPVLELEDALDLTVEWYRAFAAGDDVRSVTLEQIGKVLSQGLRQPQAHGKYRA